MLVRIVRMHFKEDTISDFINLFNSVKPDIEKTDGCIELRLMKNLDLKYSLVTYSVWENATTLNKYRGSEFFKNTWGKTKLLFSDKADAFSMHEYEK